MTAEAERLAEAVGRSMLADDAASRALGMVLEEIAPGRARMRMVVRDDMLNGHDLCHGGLIFTLADSAFAFACNARNHVTVAAAAAAEMHVVSPAGKGETLLADARERARAGRNGIYDVEMTESSRAVSSRSFAPARTASRAASSRKERHDAARHRPTQAQRARSHRARQPRRDRRASAEAAQGDAPARL